MKDLKIRVANKVESKEAQELFFKLGYCWAGSIKDFFYIDTPNCMINWSNGHITVGDDYDKNRREITLQELRDMVNPMKEYLEKQADGSYKLVMRGIVGKDGDIEVPDGAIRARLYPNDPDGLEFENAFCQWWHEENQDWFYYADYASSARHSRVVWHREQDEPFLTPETTLNDQYAEIEQVRKQTIEATLAERQAQYGCFEDVARTTGKIMEALSEVRTNGLNDLPHTHRMALYMIASKMARIVNGDFNSIDEWHDIAGYATLVERLIDG